MADITSSLLNYYPLLPGSKLDCIFGFLLQLDVTMSCGILLPDTAWSTLSPLQGTSLNVTFSFRPLLARLFKIAPLP